MNLLANLLLITGLAAIIRSLFAVSKLISALPEGWMRKRWYFLCSLILFFIVGYIGQIYFFWGAYSAWSTLLVPAIFCCGGIFVWAVCGISLQTTIDLKKVLRENNTDALTHVYNRRYLDQKLDEEIDRASRYSIPLSIMMFDIDHFKAVNDTWGHPVGDKVLVEFGELINSVIRASDIVARYGGEEFLVITTSTNKASACHLAERIRKKTEEKHFSVKGDEGVVIDLDITVSAGVAELVKSPCNREEFIKLADDALYQAKNSGRNRVVTCEEESQETLDWEAGMNPGFLAVSSSSQPTTSLNS